MGSRGSEYDAEASYNQNSDAQKTAANKEFATRINSLAIDFADYIMDKVPEDTSLSNYEKAGIVSRAQEIAMYLTVDANNKNNKKFMDSNERHLEVNYKMAKKNDGKKDFIFSTDIDEKMLEYVNKFGFEKKAYQIQKELNSDPEFGSKYMMNKIISYYSKNKKFK